MVKDVCLHEEQLLSHSRAIEKLTTEMSYKKEKLDDLKEDNRRMEEKIDEIKDCVNELIVKSKTDDDKIEKKFSEIESSLDKRILALETKQQVLEEQDKKNREDTNLKIAIIGIVFTAISVLIGVFTFYFTTILG